MFVNTMEGPQKTPSSNVTPLKTETLFCILQFWPIETSGPITTFWPILQFSPIFEPDSMWEKCQILVPGPISAFFVDHGGIVDKVITSGDR